MGRESSASIPTSYGLDGLAIHSRWERDFPILCRRVPTQPPAQRISGFFPGEKAVGTWGYLAPWLKKEYSYTSTLPLDFHSLL